MNYSQMKNIVVLRDIPSNIVDEAIVILKNSATIKRKEIIENRNKNVENKEFNYEFAVKEAENVIQEYLENIEKRKEPINISNKIISNYRKLKIYSFILGVTTIIGIIVSIIK